MSTTIPQRDLRNHNAQIIDRVRAGEAFIVTRDGIPVADLVPHVPSTKPPVWRSSDNVPRWDESDANDDVARDWLADIRSLDDFLDDTSRDPWEEQQG